MSQHSTQNFESTGDEELDKSISNWFQWNKEYKNNDEITNLLKNKNFDELKSRMLTRLSFGTAGIRGRMEAGFGRFNQLTLIQISQALAEHIVKSYSDQDRRRVVVGFDGRHNSQKFAQLVVGALRRVNIKVFFYNKCAPTPLVAFGVRYFKCCCGVMITASHNPKWDNGFKLFWECTAQAENEHEDAVLEEMQKNPVPVSFLWDTTNVDDDSSAVDEAFNAYLLEMEKLNFYKHASIFLPNIMYTAMHGVGTPYVRGLFDHMDICSSLFLVDEQCEIDPEFTTVKSPNPEEKASLEMATLRADKMGIRLVLATDPDADRLAVAEKQNDGKWMIFTGDQIGTILAWFLLHCRRQFTYSDIQNTCMVSSVVSSKFIKTMSNAEGFIFHETLTGFKHIGNKCNELLEQNHSVLLAYEEAIGFMCNSTILDKDGISAALVIAQIAAFLKAHETNSLLNDQLERLYNKYGRHVTSNSYFMSPSGEVTSQLFNDLRNYGGENKYPKFCGPYSIKAVRDLTTGFDSNYEDNQAVLPLSLVSQMITFYFENSITATIRASGTEPKIKFYVEYIGDPVMNGLEEFDGKAEDANMRASLAGFLEIFVDQFFRPAYYGLKPR